MDPRTQDRIAAGTQVLERARAIYGELQMVLNDLEEVVQAWPDAQREEPDDRRS